MFRQDIRGTIKGFVEPYKDHDFVVCTGYTSIQGIVALDELIPAGQPVTLIVGDIRPKYFSKDYDSDRYKALRAINERPITVYNWYRKQPRESIAHGKAIIVTSEDQSIIDALVGSANMTINGLDYNNEIMVRCDPNYHKHLDRYIKECSKYQPATRRLERIITQTDNNKPKRPTYSQQASRYHKKHSKSILTELLRRVLGK